MDELLQHTCGDYDCGLNAAGVKIKGSTSFDFTTLDEVEELLDPKYFYRANRQPIVHIDAIQSVKPHENQKLTLTLKAPLKME